MKKQLFSLLLCFLLFLGVALPTNAYSSYVNDEAGLLSNSEIAELEILCSQFRSEYGMDLALLTVNSLRGKTPMVYADDYYEANYGIDGILLLISMENRDWYISTAGTAIEAFSDSDLADIENGLLPYLSDGAFYDGFCYFISDAEYYVNDESVSDLTAVLFMTIPAGAIIAGIVLLIMRATMNTKQAQHNAASYENEGSYHLRINQDLFLYSNVSKRPKPQNNTSGSTTHRSSSGRSHGGRGGKF